MALTILQPLKKERGLVGVEKVTLAYALVTALIALCLWTRLSAPQTIMLTRLCVVAGMALALVLYRLKPCRLTLLVRYFYPLSLLSVWYPETYEFCRVFDNLDWVFARADQWLFGFQPALSFSQACPDLWYSEALNLGYFAYYPMIALTVIVPLFKDTATFSRTAFIVLAAFFLYYLIYLFVPVGGPQYYFHTIGLDQAASGTFDVVGPHSRIGLDMLPSPGGHGLFRTLVESAQASGERPTAAFPSSHVGVSTILMLILRRDNRRLMWWLMPLYLLLCMATVYIQAHYFIDVVFGFVSALLFYVLLDKIYPRVERFGYAEPPFSLRTKQKTKP